MKLVDEFKTFIARGNVIDLAVGIIIGAAFTGIVNSLVTDVINPIIGIAIGGVDFSEYYLNLDFTHHYDTLDTAVKAGAPVIKYGLFINAIIKFLIISFVVFMLVKQINRIKAKIDDRLPGQAPPENIVLLREIRDALKAK